MDPYPDCRCDHAVAEMVGGRWFCASCFGVCESPFGNKGDS